MTTIEIVIGLVVVLPITAYMVMKFGAAGYFRARRREMDRNCLMRERKHESSEE